jgi:hypothetical protein
VFGLEGFIISLTNKLLISFFLSKHEGLLVRLMPINPISPSKGYLWGLFSMDPTNISHLPPYEGIISLSLSPYNPTLF